MANHTGEFPNDRGPLDDQALAILKENMRLGSPTLRGLIKTADMSAVRVIDLHELLAPLGLKIVQA